MAACTPRRPTVTTFLIALQVITISGRTIRKEAQASPDRADEAIRHIDDLLSQLPAADTAKATAFRKARQLLPIG